MPDNAGKAEAMPTATQDAWKRLEAECHACQNCELAQTRTHPVFGVGCPSAEVLLVGEAPGDQEDQQGEPFVGRSGKLLDQFLASIDLSRWQNIYIANMLKCRPPANRDPKPQEQTVCMPWLTQQVQLMQPKILVCLGRIAAQRLIRKDFKVKSEHGAFHWLNGIWRMGTFHPAMLLRDPRLKPDAMQDFLQLRAKIHEVCTHTYHNTQD